jgi:hypothetical protein
MLSVVYLNKIIIYSSILFKLLVIVSAFFLLFIDFFNNSCEIVRGFTLIGALVLSCLSSELYSYFYYFYLFEVGFNTNNDVLVLENCTFRDDIAESVKKSREASSSTSTSDTNTGAEASSSTSDTVAVHPAREGAG